MWIDAEAHDGHVLKGASTLVERGVPTIFEFHPAGLKITGGMSMVHEVAEENYTHFVDMRRRDAELPRFGLRPVTELSRLEDRFREGSFTDVLLLRLDATQASR